jgi:hypothetical protein
MTTGGRTARSDLIGGAGWVVFGLAVLICALRMDRFEQMGATLYTMPGFVPGLIGVTLMLLGAALALRGLRRRLREPVAEAEPLFNARALVMLGLTLGYAAGLVGRVPFWLGTTLFVAAFVWLFTPRERPPLRRAVVAVIAGVATAATIVMVFEQVFFVRLP